VIPQKVKGNAFSAFFLKKRKRLMWVKGTEKVEPISTIAEAMVERERWSTHKGENGQTRKGKLINLMTRERWGVF